MRLPLLMLRHQVRNHVEDGLGLRVANSLLDRPVLDHSGTLVGNEMEHDFSSYMNKTKIDTTCHFVPIGEEQTLTIISQLKPKKVWVMTTSLKLYYKNLQST